MSRKSVKKGLSVAPDYKYGSVDVAKFINMIMLRGKKSIAEKIFYGAIDGAAAKLGVEGMEMFDKIIKNAAPNVEVRSRRIGGATYQIPASVSAKRSLTLAMRALILSARKRAGGRNMVSRLMAEFMDAFNERGGAIKIKEDLHKVAEANKALSHFMW